MSEAAKAPPAHTTVSLVMSYRAALVLYKVLSLAPRNGYDDDIIDALREEMIDKLEMRDAVEAGRAAREAERKARETKSKWSLPPRRRSKKELDDAGTRIDTRTTKPPKSKPKKTKKDAPAPTPAPVQGPMLDHVAAAVKLAEDEQKKQD